MVRQAHHERRFEGLTTSVTKSALQNLYVDFATRSNYAVLQTAIAVSLDAHDAIADVRQAIEYSGIVTWDDEPWIARQRGHPLLRAKVRRGVERLRDRLVRIQVLVQVHIVGREDDRCFLRPHAHVL